jgi:hypothetical protein
VGAEGFARRQPTGGGVKNEDQGKNPNEISVAGKTFRWHDNCHVLQARGIISDFSKTECFRACKLLLEDIEAGRVEQIKRGEYMLTDGGSGKAGPRKGGKTAAHAA